jgi:site-specific recombinase XerD
MTRTRKPEKGSELIQARDGALVLEAAPERRSEAAAAGFLLGYTGHTRAAYIRDLRDFGAWCAQTALAPLEATRAHVEAYVRSLESEGRSASTVARRLSTLAGYFRYAVAEGLLDRSPMQHVRRPRVPDDSPTLGLDREEARGFLAAAEVAGARDHALACLLLLNGLRVSEACAAAVADLGDERGHRVLRVLRKGGRREDVPLAPRTVQAIQAHLGERDSGRLLRANDGGELDRHDATRIIRRLATAAGIRKRVSPHSLRHTAVTLALDAGVSLRDVQDFAGHADPRTTRRYDRGRRSLDRHATYALASFVANGGTQQGEEKSA